MKFTVADRVALQMARRGVPRKQRESFRALYTQRRLRLSYPPALAVNFALREMGLRSIAVKINAAIESANQREGRLWWR